MEAEADMSKATARNSEELLCCRRDKRMLQRSRLSAFAKRGCCHPQTRYQDDSAISSSRVDGVVEISDSDSYVTDRAKRRPGCQFATVILRNSSAHGV